MLNDDHHYLAPHVEGRRAYRPAYLRHELHDRYYGLYDHLYDQLFVSHLNAWLQRLKTRRSKSSNRVERGSLRNS